MPKTETEKFSLYGGSVVVDFYPNSHRYKLIEVDGVAKNEWLPSPSTVVGKLDKSQQLMKWAVDKFEEALVFNMRDGVSFTRDDLTSMINLCKMSYMERKQQAADVGTAVHEFAEKALQSIEQAEVFANLPEREQEMARQGAEAFKSWVLDINPEILKREFIVYSKKHGFVGQCDGLIDIKGKRYIIDYKTSKGIYTSQIYQLSAYLKAYEEETGEKLHGAQIVNFVKDDVTDQFGNVTKPAGSFITMQVSRSQLVTAFKAFKGLLDVHRIDYPLYKSLTA